MVMQKLFSGIYKDKKVFVTGHTGFKGSWLVFWLEQLGADVLGYSLEPNTNPNHFSLLNLNCKSVIGDIRDFEKLSKVISDFKPDIVFHLAAQPLVRRSYNEPIYTLEVNIIGTAKLLEACKKVDSIKAIVNITSDKCYENKEWVWGYREIDPMGGYDPYSASKGCAEIVTSSYRNSYFNLNKYKIEHNVLLASCRAGNVIGGGDWSEDRLIPDIMRAASKNESVLIRNPQAIRPWQHVLESLSGYLMLGQKLLEGKKEFAEGWNFGPNNEEIFTVYELIEKMKNVWDKINYRFLDDKSLKLHESKLLKLDCSKAFNILKWKPVWDIDTAIEKTVNWYKAFYEKNKILTSEDLESYINDAKKKNLGWATL